MRNPRHAIVAAAVAAILPVAAQAAVMTVSFDMNDITISKLAAGPYVAPATVAGASLGGTSAAPVLTIPAGYYVRYGLDGSITDNDGLGLTGFQVGVNNSNPAISIAQTNPVKVNSYFASLSTKGLPDGAGGVSSSVGTAGLLIPSNNNKPTFGVSAPQELFNSLQISPLGIGTTTFSVTDVPLAFYYATTEPGTTSELYISSGYEAGVDTISPLPALTINIGVVPEPTTAVLSAVVVSALIRRTKRR